MVMGILGCRSSQPPEGGHGPQIEKRYPQKFKHTASWVVLEWAGKPHALGSGFLIDKPKGIFVTNKHVIEMFDALGRGSHKIFFNGRVYNASIIKTCPLVDAGIVGITGAFNPAEFPDPAPWARQKIKLADPLFIEGFHLHPYEVREKDRAAGRDYALIPIFDKYYDLGTRNLDKEREVVLEKLSGRVTKLDVQVDMEGEERGVVRDLRFLYNLYIEMKIDWDHQFSFGGLSGSAVKNDQGEVVGIVTAERRNFKKEIDSDILIPVYDTILITPIEAVNVLEPYLKPAS